MESFDHKLVLNFCLEYGVFEYALKSLGFAKQNRFGTVKPDWKNYALKIEESFENEQSPELKRAVEYLLKQPPKMQSITEDETLGWADTSRRADETDILWLVLLVKTVRNNLFHGGESPYDSTRDAKLLRASLIVLETWAKLDPAFQTIFSTAKQRLLGR